MNCVVRVPVVIMMLIPDTSMAMCMPSSAAEYLLKIMLFKDLKPVLGLQQAMLAGCCALSLTCSNHQWLCSLTLSIYIMYNTSINHSHRYDACGNALPKPVENTGALPFHVGPQPWPGPPKALIARFEGLLCEVLSSLLHLLRCYLLPIKRKAQARVRHIFVCV